MNLVATDERSHAPGEGVDWIESWGFDFATDDASLGGYVRLSLWPNRGVCWYWAALVGTGRDLVTLVDTEVPLPRNGSLEIRAEGLWADHIVEDPFDHLSVGCEAFAVRLDDPAEAFGRLWGERVGFGLDLGWETDGGVLTHPGPPAGDGYEVPCRVVGEVLVGAEQIALDAAGWRSHTWGPGRPWTSGVRGRFADGGWLRDDASVAAEPVGFAPLALPGQTLLLALCRFRELGTDREGSGWLSWNS